MDLYVNPIPFYCTPVCAIQSESVGWREKNLFLDSSWPVFISPCGLVLLSADSRISSCSVPGIYPIHSIVLVPLKSPPSPPSPRKRPDLFAQLAVFSTQKKNHEKVCSFPTSLRWPLAFIVPASRTSGVTRPRPSSHAKPQYKQSLQNFPQLQFALFVPFQPVSRRLRFRWTWSPN